MSIPDFRIINPVQRRRIFLTLAPRIDTRAQIYLASLFLMAVARVETFSSIRAIAER